AILASGAASLPAPAAHTQARLVLAAESAKPDDTIQAAIVLHMDPGWHTYWKNPGQSGLPTTVTWELPPGVSAGEIQWPVTTKGVSEWLAARAWWEEPATTEKRAAVIEWPSPQPATEVDFYPDKSDDFEVLPATEKLPSVATMRRLRVRVTKSVKDWPKE